MFEKFSISDVDSAGRGGEYTVQAGFGWTNGVVLWVASTYGNVLVAPQCPDLLAEGTSTSTSMSNISCILGGAREYLRSQASGSGRCIFTFIYFSLFLYSSFRSVLLLTLVAYFCPTPRPLFSHSLPPYPPSPSPSSLSQGVCVVRVWIIVSKYQCFTTLI